ncbi:putative beta-phosphoglucomutase [Nitrospira sp. KM1]|uniref:HAD family hydrolase n=1 Tax=Nitrospira sp. KM1 TaxID=1936990 RepID=UPI0013A751BB|nr:HAD family phosphatase [Nitrospira sp. KM1]BCA55045.1 putative beta-phosphoglucomutase [Nitrospira sp. KM1]
MIRAMIFDFNGVLADDESSHVACFQQALAEFGLILTAEDYYGTYLGMDERTCAGILLTSRDGTLDTVLLDRITARKTQLFLDHTAVHRPQVFDGVTKFVLQAQGRYRLAIASGGRRHQIANALAGADIEKVFEVIVAAEDCPIGKPDPAIYALTLARLNAIEPTTSLAPDQCLVIEDSLAGVRSARAAGMRILALSTTYPAEKLCEADLVLPNLLQVTPEFLAACMTRAG